MKGYSINRSLGYSPYNNGLVYCADCGTWLLPQQTRYNERGNQQCIKCHNQMRTISRYKYVRRGKLSCFSEKTVENPNGGEKTT